MKKFAGIFWTLLIFGLITSYIGYQWIFAPNTQNIQPIDFFISSGSGFEEVRDRLVEEKIIRKEHSFNLVAQLMKYDKSSVPPGRYIIDPGLSNRQLVQKLRAGLQSPVSLTLSSARTINDLAGAIDNHVEADSLSILNVLTDDEFITELGFTRESIIGIVIPNTYEIYWNTDAKAILNRLKKEYDKFWNKNRIDKLAQLNLTRHQCSTLASIVEKETIIHEERPAIAGVYLNRLANDIPLQADPTVVFGVGDFTIRRVLNKHLAFDSPYNTYIYSGLPPGPICMPSISSIDAVLNAEKHDYLFFCAKPGYNGAHAFAKTNREHERNATVYRRWLNQQNIRS